MNLKKLSILILALFLATGCSIKINDDKVSIDGGNLGGIEISDENVNIDGGDLGSIEINDDGIELESDISLDDIDKIGEDMEAFGKEMEKFGEDVWNEDDNMFN